MKSIAYITGYTFGTAKSLVSRIPQPDVDQIKADFKQAIADQQQPGPQPETPEQYLQQLMDKHPDFAEFIKQVK